MKDIKDNKTIDAFEKKPMTAAERKAKQRANMKGRVRLDCYISEMHRDKLEVLRGSISIAEYLENLIDDKHDY